MTKKDKNKIDKDVIATLSLVCKANGLEYEKLSTDVLGLLFDAFIEGMKFLHKCNHSEKIEAAIITDNKVYAETRCRNCGKILSQEA